MVLSALRQYHRLIQSEFAIRYVIVLHVSIYSILFSLRSFSSCLSLSPHLPVTSIIPFIFPSITC